MTLIIPQERANAINADISSGRLNLVELAGGASRQKSGDGEVLAKTLDSIAETISPLTGNLNEELARYLEVRYPSSADNERNLTELGAKPSSNMIEWDYSSCILNALRESSPSEHWVSERKWEYLNNERVRKKNEIKRKKGKAEVSKYEPGIAAYTFGKKISREITECKGRIIKRPETRMASYIERFGRVIFEQDDKREITSCKVMLDSEYFTAACKDTLNALKTKYAPIIQKYEVFNSQPPGLVVKNKN